MYVARPPTPLGFVERGFAVHLERLRYIPEKVVRFWTAELSSALEYLHKQRIIHRCVYHSSQPFATGT